MADYTYRKDQAGPAIGFRWNDYTGSLYDFSVPGWSFELALVTFNTNLTVKVLDNSNIIGSAGSATAPNVLLKFPLNFFSDVPADIYMLHLKAVDADSLPYFFSLRRIPTLQVIDAPTGP